MFDKIVVIKKTKRDVRYNTHFKMDALEGFSALFKKMEDMTVSQLSRFISKNRRDIDKYIELKRKEEVTK